MAKTKFKIEPEKPKYNLNYHRRGKKEKPVSIRTQIFLK